MPLGGAVVYPAAMADAPEDLPDVRSDLARALKLIADRAPEYERRKAMYDGTAREYAASAAVGKIIDASAAAHPLGFAHIPVDAVVDKAQLQGFDAEGGAADELARLVDELSLLDEADDWQVRLGYFGDYYTVVDPLEETTGGAATALRVTASSPLTTVAVYSPRDSASMLYGVKRWKTGEGESAYWSAMMYYDDVTLLLETAPGAGDEPKAEAFLPLEDAQVDPDAEQPSWRVPHLGGLPLLVHHRIGGKPYGEPLHVKAFGAQDAITKISAVNLATVDAQGFPARYALADPMAETDDDIDDDFGTDGPSTTAADRDGMTTATTGASRLRDLPGTIKLLRGIKSVGTFEAASPDGFLKNLDWYVRAMAVQTGTPLFEFDLDGEQPSGEARRRASARLNRRVEKFTRAAGASFARLADVLLAVRGVDATAARVVARWAPIETETDAEGMELVAAKVENGVPLRVALLEAGYTAEQVDAWAPDGSATLSPKAAALLATALRDFAQAETLGAVTSAELAEALPYLLTGARGEGPRLDDDDDDPAPSAEA